jgi:hypothetical protein
MKEMMFKCWLPEGLSVYHETMAEVLGRVVASDLGRPRGPDATHRIRVPRAWLKQGMEVSLDLPRHLVCAACDGGGCDTCDRSGGVTLRDRGAPADVVDVSLPQSASDEAFVIRLPERGGLAPTGSGLPRGHLLLRVEPSDEADASVSLAIRHPAIEAARRALSKRPLPLGPRMKVALGALAVSVILLAIWLLSRR